MGLERTFEILRDAPPHLTREVYLSALQETHPEILELTVTLLLENPSEEVRFQILERFHAFPERLQDRLLQDPRPYLNQVAALAEVPVEAQRMTALAFIAQGADPAMAAIPARALQGSEPMRHLAARYFAALARVLASSRAGPAPAEGVDAQPRALLHALLQALPDYERHRQPAVLRCLVELEGDAHEPLHGILAGPRAPAREDLIVILREQTTVGTACLLLRIARSKDPDLRALAAELCTAKTEGEFGANVLSYLHGLRDADRELVASRTTDAPWWPAVRGRLAQLRTDERDRLFDFVAATEAPPDLLAGMLADLFEVASPTLRLRIARKASAVRRIEMAPLLARAVQEDNEMIQLAALEALEAVNPPDLPRLLTPLINSPRREVRHQASRILSHQSFARYLERFHALDPDTRAAAGKALVKLDDTTVDRLSDELQSLDPARRLKALNVLGAVGKEKEMETVLYDLFRDRDRKIRATVIKAIGLLGTVDAIKVLLQALSDPDRRIRANAIEAFEDIGNPRFCEILLPFLNDPDNRARGNAAKALWILGRREEVSRALRSMLKSPDELMRLTSVWTLAEIEHPDLNGLLGEVIAGDASEKVRAKAKEAMEIRK